MARGNGNGVQARFELLRLVGEWHEELEFEGNPQRRKRVGLLIFILPSFPRKWRTLIARWVHFGGAWDKIEQTDKHGEALCNVLPYIYGNFLYYTIVRRCWRLVDSVGNLHSIGDLSTISLRVSQNSFPIENCRLYFRTIMRGLLRTFHAIHAVHIWKWWHVLQYCITNLIGAVIIEAQSMMTLLNSSTSILNTILQCDVDALILLSLEEYQSWHDYHATSIQPWTITRHCEQNIRWYPIHPIDPSWCAPVKPVAEYRSDNHHYHLL